MRSKKAHTVAFFIVKLAPGENKERNVGAQIKEHVRTLQASY